MALELVNVGAAPNDGTGDLLRDAFIKINNSLLDLDGRKPQVFYSTPTHPYFVGDIYIAADAIYACIQNSSGSYNAADWTTVLDIGSFTTDHGSLSGLSDDDHPQYYNQTRGDARYSQLSHTHTGVYSPVGHNHSGVYEPVLGNPPADGYILSSTAAGVRSWIAPPTGGGGGSLPSDVLEVVNEGLPNEYLRCKLPFAGDFEIQAWSNTGWLPPTIWESVPLATTLAIGGILLPGGTTLYLRADGTWAAPPGGGTGMVYPSGSGIPIVVSGTSWGTTITDNSINWNTAYGWGDHAGLYRGISWVPSWSDVTGKPTSFTPAAHQLDSATYHTVSGLTTGHFLRASSGTTFGFSALLKADVEGVLTGTITSHNHTGTYQPLATNLTSLAGLTYASLAFVKMSAAGTFTLDTNTYITASGTTTLTNKTINATNNTITDTSIATGDILKSNGTKFVRLARGSALQVLRVNSGGTDLEYVTLDSLVTTNFSILQESGKLVIKYGSTIIASFSSAGLFTTADEVVAFGTP